MRKPNDPILAMAWCGPILSLLFVPLAACADGEQHNSPGTGANAGGYGPDAGSEDTGSDEAAADAPDSSCIGGPVGVLGAPCCTPGEQACGGNAKKQVLICYANSGTWIPFNTCSGSQLCDTSSGPRQGTCQDPVVGCIGRSPGDSFCDGQVSFECGPDLLTTTRETPCEFACNNGVCAGSCTPGGRQCEGTVPQVCTSEGVWESEDPCAFVCQGAGTCAGVCVPGRKDCIGQVPRTCDSGGEWLKGLACQNQACVNASCQGLCEPGAKKCSGDTPQTCSSEGEWQSGAECAGVCVDGACCPSTLSTANPILKRNEFICSPNGYHRFGLDVDGNLILLSDDKVMWSSGAHCDAKYLNMQPDGNLVLIDSNVSAVWHSGTHSHPGAHLVLRDDGRARIVRSSEELWSIPTGGAVLPQQLCFRPVADTYVDIANSNSNFGVSNMLRVDNDPNNLQSILRFVIPANVGDFQQTTLRLFVTSSTDDGPRVHLVSDPWTESGVTWNTLPTSTGPAIADFPKMTAGWAEVDVSLAIRSPGTYSILLSAVSGDAAEIESREGDNPPQLRISIPEDIDDCPSDPNKTEAGVCGCNVPEGKC